MKCKHKFKTTNTISRKAHQEGSKKFKSGFEEADSYGIKILAARQQQCVMCGKKRTTIEISKTQLDTIYSQLSKIVNDEHDELDQLSPTEHKVRNFLINVSKGTIKTKHRNMATYKETWLNIYPLRPFGRGNTNEVVGWIVNISDFDTKHGRPPLNSLVVRSDTGKPGDSWENWRKNAATRYKTVEEAQQACWEYY